MDKKTTIQISLETKKQLDTLKMSTRESYNDVIDGLIEDNFGLSKIAIADLEEALEDVKNGEIMPHSEVKALFGMD